MTFDNTELVKEIAREYNLAITIKPDGSIIGLSDAKAKLRRVYEIRSKSKGE